MTVSEARTMVPQSRATSSSGSVQPARGSGLVPAGKDGKEHFMGFGGLLDENIILDAPLGDVGVEGSRMIVGVAVERVLPTHLDNDLAHGVAVGGGGGQGHIGDGDGAGIDGVVG